jgi:hypothetical protein
VGIGLWLVSYGAIQTRAGWLRRAAAAAIGIAVVLLLGF